MRMQRASFLFLNALEKIDCGTFTVELANGHSYSFSGSQKGPNADIKLHDDAVITNVAARGDIALAHDYRFAKWESKDIASLVDFFLRNEHSLHRYISGSKLMQLFAKLSYFFTQNTKKGSRKNIHAHYDLGNDFYALWLDPTMTYSSALFAHPNDDLATAQHRKYDRILEAIGQTPQSVLEIGCGWGGFAERCAEQHNHAFKGITVSSSQHEYASRRLNTKTNNIVIDLEDYRDLQNSYDAIVSIEMFEAVGEKYWRTYFQKIKSLLKAHGKAVIQTITIADTHFAQYRKQGDAIRSYIFPGGMLPSVEQFTHHATEAGLVINDIYQFGDDYARTLSLWLERFEAQADKIRALRFDESFIRLWRFYLAACAGAFRAKRTNVMQVELCHA